MTSSNDVFPRKADPRGVPSTPTYDEALRICGREAAVTFIAALGLFAFFWGSIALFKDVHERFWGPAAVVLGRRLRRVCALSAGGDVHCEAVFQGDAA